MISDLAIDLKNVTKIYSKRVHALAGIEMHVRRGEIFGLLGPNGAGKSTLVKIIMTVVRPTRAEGMVLGQPVGHKSTLQRVGYLPENHRFPRYLTGRQTLEFFGALNKVDRITARKRAGELLDAVRMQEWGDRKIGTYSKGMMQRIGLAQSLMNNPDLVLLDEPTDGVDPLGRREILDVMGRLRAEGKTVFINSHALSELETICDRVAILAKGRVAMQGTIDDLTIAKQRYEVEVVWDDPPNVRKKILAALPAGWKPIQTTAPMPGLRNVGAPPLPTAPAMPGVPPLPGAPRPVPPLPGQQQAVQFSAMVQLTAPVARTIDRGALSQGAWIELDGPLLRIGTTDPSDVQPILDALRSQGLQIRRVQPMRVSLEDLFIETVTDPITGAHQTPGAAGRNPMPIGGRP